MEYMPVKDYNLLRRLLEMRVLVIHPEDSERHALLEHIKRIGCHTDAVWPAPNYVPEKVDVVLFLVNHLHVEGSLSWMASTDSIARIAIITYETHEIVIELERLHVHGVLSKPIRIFGILAALTTAIAMARQERRLKKRIQSLDETLKARRAIEQAVSILSESKGILEEEAYKRLRDKSMKDKCSIASIAHAIIASNGV